MRTRLTLLCTIAFLFTLNGLCHAQGVSGKAAWQTDPRLKEKWQEMSGRFIFQQTCLACHKSGPDEYTKKEWQKSLKGFPAADHPKLPNSFKDLTAMFDVGKMVPNQKARYSALQTFLLKNAPARKKKADKDADPVELFPGPGDKAPDFKVKDANGRVISLKKLKGKKNVVVVFSRADW